MLFTHSPLSATWGECCRNVLKSHLRLFRQKQERNWKRIAIAAFNLVSEAVRKNCPLTEHCMQLCVEKLLNSLSQASGRKTKRTPVCLKHLPLPLSTTFRTKCFSHKLEAKSLRNKLKKISGIFFLVQVFPYCSGRTAAMCKMREMCL